MGRAWVRASWVFGALLCFAGGASAECGKDVDCEGELVCEAGACVESPPAPAAPVEAPAPVGAAPPASSTARGARIREPVAMTREPPREERPIRYKRRSSGLMAGGIVTASIGTIALLGAATSERVDCDDSLPSHCERTPNYGAWVLAGVLLGSGIPMILFGSKMVPDTSTPSAQLTPWVTPRGGGLGLQLSL